MNGGCLTGGAAGAAAEVGAGGAAADVGAGGGGGTEGELKGTVLGGGVGCLSSGAGLTTTRSEYTELAGDSTFCRDLGASVAALLAALGGGGGGAGESEEACFLFNAAFTAPANEPGFSAGILSVVRPVSPDSACTGPLARPEEAAPEEEEEAAGFCS